MSGVDNFKKDSDIPTPSVEDKEREIVRGGIKKSVPNLRIIKGGSQVTDIGTTGIKQLNPTEYTHPSHSKEISVEPEEENLTKDVTSNVLSRDVVEHLKKIIEDSLKHLVEHELTPMKKTLTGLEEKLVSVRSREYSDPTALCAVRFTQEDRSRGAYVLHTSTECVGLRGEIFVIREKDLDVLDRAMLNYEKHKVQSNNEEDILRYFGIDQRDLEREREELKKELRKYAPSMLERLIKYIKR